MTDLSFLALLKIIFIFIYILINLGLLYFEKLDSKYNALPGYNRAGVGSELKKAVALFWTVASGYSYYLTIRDEHQKNKAIEEVKNNLRKTIEESKKSSDEQTNRNFLSKMRTESLDLNFTNLQKNHEEKSKLQLEIANATTDWSKDTTGSKEFPQEFIRKKQAEILLLDMKNQRLNVDIRNDIDTALKYHDIIKIEPDEGSIVDKVNNVNKSSVFSILEDLSTKFESLDGISKLAFILTFSSSIIF